MTDVDILSIVEHRQWLVLAGALLMAIVVFGRAVAARARLTGLADRVVSVASAYLQDLSWMLPAAGYDYWPWALLAALRGTLMSGGLADLIADLIKRRWHLAVSSMLGGLLLLAAGCGAGPIVPDPHPGTGPEPCAVERALVEGLDDAVGAVDDVLPDDAPKAAEGLSYARGGVEEGLAAVAACEALTSEGRSGLSAILPWITVAGHVARGLLAILGAAHVHIPDALMDILHSLGLASAAPPIERTAPYQVAYFD